MFNDALPVAPLKSDGGHIYGVDTNGTVHAIQDIIGRNGKVRRADLRDLRAVTKEKPMVVVNGDSRVEVVHALESVTTVMGLLDKKGLKDWWNRLIIETCHANPKDELESMDQYVERAIGIASRGRDAAGILGTKVHANIEKAIRGEEVEGDVSKYVEAGLRVLRDNKITVCHQEIPVYAKQWMIAGRLDLEGVIEISGKAFPCIVDFKNRKSPQSYSTDVIQIAAYGVGYFGLNRWNTHGVGINVLIDTTNPGEAKAVIHDQERLRSAWMAWCGLVNIYIHEKKFDPR